MSESADLTAPAPSNVPERDPEGSRVVGFKRRLETHALTARDREVLKLAQAIKDARTQGVTLTTLAKQLGMSLQSLSAFAARGVCRVAMLHLDEIATTDDDKVRARDERERQARFRALEPRALQFYEDSLAQHEEVDPESGEKRVVWSNPAMAQWATEKLTRGAGWDAPKVINRPTIKLDIHFVEQQSKDIEEDDEITRAQGARDVTLSATDYHQLDEEGEDD